MNPIITDFAGKGLAKQVAEQDTQLAIKSAIKDMSRGRYRKLVAESRQGSGLSKNVKAEKSRAARKRKQHVRKGR